MRVFAAALGQLLHFGRRQIHPKADDQTLNRIPGFCERTGPETVQEIDNDQHVPGGEPVAIDVAGVGAGTGGVTGIEKIHNGFDIVPVDKAVTRDIGPYQNPNRLHQILECALRAALLGKEIQLRFAQVECQRKEFEAAVDKAVGILSD